MAIQTKSRFFRGSSLVFDVFTEYDDTDFRTVNDDGDPDDFRVIRWFGTNYSDAPFTIEVKLLGGKRWKAYTLSAGQEFSVNAGGRVKYESDVPEWRYG